MGRSEAIEAAKVCEDWKLIENIWAIVFDTTSTNTGVHNGACTILEAEFIKRKLLWLACRHHIPELILKAVWKRLFGPSSSPSNQTFIHFRDRIWADIDTTADTRTLFMNSRKFKSRRDKVIREFYKPYLARDDIVRGDYRESAEISMQLLGVTPPKGKKWRKPQGTSDARFMSLFLYAGKIFAFSDQLVIEDGDLELYERFLMFCALYYIPYFLSASIGVDAPYNDLEFWNTMKSFSDKEIADAAIMTQERHMWYITEELTPLCLFSDKLSHSEKGSIAKKILKMKKDYNPEIFGQPTQPIVTDRTRLIDLIGPQSWHIFSKFTSTEFLSRNPNTWPTDAGYNTMHKVLRNLKVVNDVAERAVKLVSEYAEIITTDEDQKQYLYQVVEASRVALKIDKLTKENMQLAFSK